MTDSTYLKLTSILAVISATLTVYCANSTHPKLHVTGTGVFFFLFIGFTVIAFYAAVMLVAEVDEGHSDLFLNTLPASPPPPAPQPRPLAMTMTPGLAVSSSPAVPLSYESTGLLTVYRNGLTLF